MAWKRKLDAQDEAKYPKAQIQVNEEYEQSQEGANQCFERHMLAKEYHPVSSTP